VLSLITLPFTVSKTDYVLAVFSRQENGILQENLLRLLETIRPNFQTYCDSIKKRTDLEGLGRITIRLIRDEELRADLIVHSREGTLPPILGKTYNAPVVVVDIIGSSTPAFNDAKPKEKALINGTYYDAVAASAKINLSAQVVDTAGDGIILAAPTELTGKELLDAFITFSNQCDDICKSLGFKGARVVFHVGEYFIGLVGTQSSGQIGAVGDGINFACKLEDEVKVWKKKGVLARIALSKSGLEYLVKRQALPAECSPEVIKLYSGVHPLVEEYYLFFFAEELRNFQQNLITEANVKKVA
jgi:hypothetical protein